MKSFLRSLLGVFALFLVLVAGAQVVPVQPAGVGMPGWVWVVILGGIAVGAYLYMKKHGQVAAAQAAVAAGERGSAAVTNLAQSGIAALTAALERAHAAQAPAVAPPAAPAAAVPITITGVVTAATARAELRDATIDPVPMTAPAPRNPLSNAPAGFPDTSPGGFPYWYALGGDGKPVGQPVLVYDGNTFGSDSEINAYKAAVAIRNLNLAAYQAPAFTGSIAMSSLTPDDWCWIDSKGNVNWNQALAGDADMFKAQTIHYFYNGLASFNPATYGGPLKSLG